MLVKLHQLALNSFFITLIICFHDLQVVDHSAMNKMNSSNLAIVFGPNLLWPKGQASLSSMGYLNNFARLLIDNYSQLFDRQQITYPPWSTGSCSHLDTNMPYISSSLFQQQNISFLNSLMNISVLVVFCFSTSSYDEYLQFQMKALNLVF